MFSVSESGFYRHRRRAVLACGVGVAAAVLLVAPASAGASAAARAGLPAWPAFINADSKVLYLGDPITVGGVANINSLKSFDAVYTSVRGATFAGRTTGIHTETTH